MILKDDFFTITACDAAAGTANFSVKLNGGHFIYRAHFPDNPITPGACIIQIVMELFGWLQQGVAFNLTTLKNAKFIAPISPQEYPEVDFLLEFVEKSHQFHVKAEARKHDRVFAKMSMVLSAKREGKQL